tara:strand:- start:2072 stop:3523 length:1452 start_codon:yes stop_codon:yes gene_type:complete
MKKTLTFVFDYFLSESPLPNGLSPQCVAEIYNLHTTKYYTKELQNDYQGDFVPIHVKNEHFVKISSFFDFKIDDDFEARFGSVNDISDRDPNISLSSEKYICVSEVRGRWKRFFDMKTSNHFFNNISKRMLSLLQSGNTILVINYMYEALCEDDSFDFLYRACIEYKVPLKNIIIISGDLDADKQYENWYKKSSYKDKYSKINIWKSLHLLECASKSFLQYSLHRNTEKNQFGYISNDFTKKDAIKIKDTIRDKYFLSYNNNVESSAKHHRQLLGGFYIKEDLIDNGLVSFGKLDIKDVPTQSYIIKNQNKYTELLPHIKKISKMSPLQLDISDKDIWISRNITANNLDCSENYRDTYFSIVCESDYVANPFLTACTIKCFGNLHPFVMLSTYKFLDKLKELGFKTFHPFIDESYDKIEDNGERILAIFNEIKRLCSKPKEELHDWYYSILDSTLVHNKKVMLEYAKGNERQDFFNRLVEFEG